MLTNTTASTAHHSSVLCVHAVPHTPQSSTTTWTEIRWLEGTATTTVFTTHNAMYVCPPQTLPSQLSILSPPDLALFTLPHMCFHYRGLDNMGIVDDGLNVTSSAKYHNTLNTEYMCGKQVSIHTYNILRLHYHSLSSSLHKLSSGSSWLMIISCHREMPQTLQQAQQSCKPCMYQTGGS